MPYGLAAYAWTRDGARDQRVAESIDAGMAWINSQNVRALRTPFGCMKQSGIGREGGHFSFDFYTEWKTFRQLRGTHAIPAVRKNSGAPWRQARSLNMAFDNPGKRQARPCGASFFQVACRGITGVENSGRLGRGRATPRFRHVLALSHGATRDAAPKSSRSPSSAPKRAHPETFWQGFGRTFLAC